MKLAIMQPYIFPYIGYFQLIHAVDKFIFYDDVAYIKGGWINRNRILHSNCSTYITIPTFGASPNLLINEVKINNQNITWKRKLLRKLEQTYSSAPNRNLCLKLVEEILDGDSDYIAEYARNSVLIFCNLLDITSEIIPSSSVYNNRHLKGEERVIDICRRETASEYINAIGGLNLYNTKNFLNAGIKLSFIEPKVSEYKQGNNTFAEALSIIDIIMWCDLSEVKRMLNDYSLIRPLL